MNLSTQTQADLARILETLDQRLYELTDEQGQPHYVAHCGEVKAVQTLRGSAEAVLNGNASAG